MIRLDFVLVTVVCASISFGIVFAQDDALNGGTLRGQITDLMPAQNPIEGVEVKIVAQDGSKEFTTKTDADGNYQHAGLPAGRYSISISKEGYDERRGKPVTIVEGGDHFAPLKMPEKGNIEPFFEVPQRKMDIVVKQQIESLLERVVEGIGERYGLDETVVKVFHQSILDSVGRALEQGGGLHAFVNAVEGGSMSLLEMLLSHPTSKAVFTEHLSEAQLQDYLDFTAARRQRDQQAVAHQMAAAFDKEFSLTAEQREKVVQLLLDATKNKAFPISMSILRLNPQQAIHLAHYRLRISLDGVLSETQSKVWKGLVNANANRERIVINLPKAEVKEKVKDEKIDKGEIADPTKKRALIRKDAVPFVKIEKEVEIVINEVMVDPRGIPPWIQISPDTAGSQEQMMEIAEAKLAAHTELLGPLDERATRRLALVAKGVAQQYIEAQDETPEVKYRQAEVELLKKIEAGEMTREQAAARLQIMRKDLAVIVKTKETDSSITDHPLYQQAIKDVLSEEAFTTYSAYQAEREAFHQQAARDVVVACMDTQLILESTQRETLEKSASQLIPGPLTEETPAEFMFFQLFPQTVDFEILTPWQQGEFERVFAPLMWRR